MLVDAGLPLRLPAEMTASSPVALLVFHFRQSEATNTIINLTHSESVFPFLNMILRHYFFKCTNIVFYLVFGYTTVMKSLKNKHFHCGGE